MKYDIESMREEMQSLLKEAATTNSVERLKTIKFRVNELIDISEKKNDKPKVNRAHLRIVR